MNTIRAFMDTFPDFRERVEKDIGEPEDRILNLKIWDSEKHYPLENGYTYQELEVDSFEFIYLIYKDDEPYFLITQINDLFKVCDFRGKLIIADSDGFLFFDSSDGTYHSK